MWGSGSGAIGRIRFESVYGVSGLANPAASECISTGPDTDGDGIPDFIEIGSDLDHPKDTDGDGVPDFRDPDSNNNGIPDGVELPGFRRSQYYYDRNDRLVGVEYPSKGLSLGYQYDGNGNIVRQVYLGYSASTNELPLLWTFLNGLSGSNLANGLFDDPDGDGWSNYQEWKAGTDPLDPNSRPNLLGLEGTNIASMSWPFAPSNFVVGVGQLDGFGAEEIVVGADGNPGTNKNILLILTEGGTGWTTQTIDIGALGVTSLAVGQADSGSPSAIYVGTRNSGSPGSVVVITPLSNTWNSTTLSLGNTGQVAYVLGLRPNNDVLIQLSTSNAPDLSLFRLVLSNQVWTVSLLGTNSAHGEYGATTEAGALRLLESGMIQVDAVETRRAVDIHGMGQCVALPFYAFDSGNHDDGGSSGTIEAWVNLRQNTGAVIMGKGSSYPTDFAGLFTVGICGLSSAIPGQFCFHASNSRGEIRSSALVNTGVWTQVAVSFSGTSASLYVNGRLDTVASGNFLVPNFNDANATGTSLGACVTPVFSGSSYYQTNGVFDGYLDEVRLWNRVLSDSEIFTNSQSMAPCNLDALRAWWSFDDGSARDLSSNQNDGVLVGGAHGVSLDSWCVNQAMIAPPPQKGLPLVWGGHPLASGSLRPTNGLAVLYAFIDDQNGDGLVDSGDAFVLNEFLLAGNGAVTNTVASISLRDTPLAPSYSIACIDYLNNGNDLCFTAEPNGQICSWTATNSTGPLQRQLFSGQHLGKTWHALSGLRTLEPGEGLIGLRVATNAPNVCDVIFWPPQSQIWTPPDVPQTAPVTSILPYPSLGSGLATNQVRLWDEEGNSSWLEMQFQVSGTKNWTNIAIVSIDGNAYGAVSAPADGKTHQVVWNAAAMLGVGVTNDMLLQGRARDVTLTGDWSPAVAYRVEIAIGHPLAADDTTNTFENAAVDIDVLANDWVQSSARKLIASVGQPLHGTTITNANSTVRYTPEANFFGSESFVYTLADGAGGMSMATVHVSVIYMKQPGIVKLDSPQSTNGYFSLLIQGEAGQVYNVQTSSNLSEWANVGTVTNNTGIVPYSEPVPTNAAQRYYRAKVVQ